MLNEELEKYKNLYSQLVSEFANLHNAHLDFIKRVSREPGYLNRKHLREITKISNKLKRQNLVICEISLQQKRLKRARLEEETSKKTKKNDMAISK